MEGRTRPQRPIVLTTATREAYKRCTQVVESPAVQGLSLDSEADRRTLLLLLLAELQNL